MMILQWRGYGGSDCVAVVFDTKELEQLLERECERFEYWPCLIADVIYDKEDVALPERFPELSNKLKSFVQNFTENKDDQAVEKIIHDFTPDLFSADSQNLVRARKPLRGSIFAQACAVRFLTFAYLKISMQSCQSHG